MITFHDMKLKYLEESKIIPERQWEKEKALRYATSFLKVVKIYFIHGPCSNKIFKNSSPGAHFI